MSWRLCSALLAAAMLGGCAHLPTGTDGLNLEQRREALQSVGGWEMRGRLTVDTGERGFQGSFNWRQHDDALELVVRGPLRNGMLQVEGPPNAMTVTARGETRTLTDPETELSELVGWWLPVASLPDWLLGFPDRSFRADTVPGADGTLASLEQRLWRVDYPQYGLAATSGGTGSEVLVPRRIDMTYGELTLKLTIDDWQPTTTAVP
ncbi:MAG TPA: lipoprotein insertase outer membrane protein LolB [Gammaproteobacteria bacterium]|jgi:outer membrane lipoprotein LolB|nr:lipoprotein insertase outer membrane protein LolB [Gammaproteobacteria bacterium]